MVFMEGSNVIFRVGFDSRMILERAEMFVMIAFAPPVIDMTAKAEAGVPGHAHWFHILQ